MALVAFQQYRKPKAPAPSEYTLAELIEHCTERPPDDSAWREFVHRFHPIIRTNVLKTFHMKLEEEGERKAQFRADIIDDLVQAVYFRLIEDRSRVLRRFKGLHENAIYQYLGMISANVVRDHFREIKAQKRPRISCSLDEILENGGEGAVPAEPGTGEASSPDSTFVMEEIETALKKVVTGRNRERDIRIFKLHYFEGMTLEEITQTLNLDISAVGVNSIVNRIVKKMRLLLIPRQKGLTRTPPRR